MKLYLATKLTAEECKQRLHNAIDPVPTPEERVTNALNTSWSPDPLSGAGRWVTGFGYSPGTRPVVGTIEDNTFQLEKLVENSFRRGPNEPPSIGPHTTGRLQSAPYGTLIEMEVERPVGRVVLIFVIVLSAFVFGFVVAAAIATSLTRTPVLMSKGGVLGVGFGALIFALPMAVALIAQQTGKAEREYLLKFVKLVCQATPLAAQKVSAGEGYTGKTGHLQ